MKDILMVYWSGTGNTEKMAEHIQKGAEGADAKVTCKPVAQAGVDDIDGYEYIILGCPSMGAEVLEEGEMEPYMASIEAKLSGKKVALFGSYDWGDGQWMRDWEERVKSAGAALVSGEGLIVNNEPQAADCEACSEFGKKIAAS